MRLEIGRSNEVLNVRVLILLTYFIRLLFEVKLNTFLMASKGIVHYFGTIYYFYDIIHQFFIMRFRRLSKNELEKLEDDFVNFSLSLRRSLPVSGSQ